MNQICAYTERPLKPIEYITDFENSKTVQNVTFSTKKLVAEENQENMAILQKLSTALPKYKKLSKLLRKKRETFLYILFDAAKKLNIENLISVENNVINLPNNAKKTRIEWKLYFKNILISCVQKKSFKKCEFAVVNSAIFKLKHLFNFKIINNELKKSDKIKKLKFISENDPSIHIPCTRKHSTQIDSSLNHKIKVEPLDIHCDTKIISENDPSIHIPCKRKHSTQIDSSLNHKIKVEPLDIHSDNTKIISHSELAIQEMSNIPKNIFILNTYLFNSSMKDGFLLLINRPETKHPRLVLSESAILCKIKFEYKMEDMSEEYSPKFKLYAMLNNVVVGTAIDFTIPKAKGKACENAINILRKKYYIIRLKNQFGSADIMNCSDLTAFGYDLLPATKDLINGNIDFRMLIKCTKDDLEDSVCDDVKPVISEESLDYNKAKKKIVKNIWKKQIKHLGDKIDPILKNFRQTNLFNDLVFQHGFGHGERKEIHRVASKHGLLVHTNKLNNKRYTIVSHKYSAIQILDHLVKIGGSNNKYELVDLSKDEYF